MYQKNKKFEIVCKRKKRNQRKAYCIISFLLIDNPLPTVESFCKLNTVLELLNSAFNNEDVTTETWSHGINWIMICYLEERRLNVSNNIEFSFKLNKLLLIYLLIFKYVWEF